MDFKDIANNLVNEHFQNLTKAVESMGDDERQAYADKFPVAIWVRAGMSEDHAFAISAN